MQGSSGEEHPALREAYTLGVSFEHVSTLLEVSIKAVNVRAGKMYIRKISKNKKTKWESHITSLPINEINYRIAKLEATWEWVYSGLSEVENVPGMDRVC